MGKIVRFDTRYAGQPHPTRKRRAAAAQFRPRRNGARWNPSGTTIFNIGMLAFVAFWLLPDAVNLPLPAWSGSAAASNDSETASFSSCHSGGGTNCVVDGDTIWYQGTKIRIADIDTPETHPPRCDEEARLGAAATQRLQGLLNAGPFSIESIDRDTDRYGRQLRILTRDGESIGGVLVDEGLARWYGSGRQSWC